MIYQERVALRLLPAHPGYNYRFRPSCQPTIKRNTILSMCATTVYLLDLLKSSTKDVTVRSSVVFKLQQPYKYSWTLIIKLPFESINQGIDQRLQYYCREGRPLERYSRIIHEHNNDEGLQKQIWCCLWFVLCLDLCIIRIVSSLNKGRRRFRGYEQRLWYSGDGCTQYNLWSK